MFYTPFRDGEFLIWYPSNGMEAMHIWTDEESSDLFCQEHPGWEALALSTEELLGAIKDQKEKGLTHVVTGRPGNLNGRMLPVDRAIAILSGQTSQDTDNNISSGCNRERRDRVSLEAIILNRLRPQYVAFYEASGASQAEAIETFEGMVEKAKMEGKRKQTSDLDANTFLALAEKNTKLRAELDWRCKEGVREVDFQWWWNMPDLERQMLVLSDEASRLGYYESLRESGRSQEESSYELRLTQPWFTEFLMWFNGPDDENKPLPIELKARVLEFQEQQNASELSHIEWRKRRVEAGSANAAIRNEIENGRL